MVHRYPLVGFFLLANAISWTLWLPLLLAEQGLIGYHPPQSLHLIGSLGPAISALIMAKICGGTVELRDLIRRMVIWRVGWIWHAIAWLSPIILFAIATLIAGLVTGWDSQTLQNFGRSPEYPGLSRVAYWIASIIFYGWGEETGWRGFALPRLQTHQSALAATLKLSLFWALWHLPLFGFSSGLGQMGFAEGVGWYLSLLTGAILFTWIVNSSGGSILVAAIFHGTMDIAFVSPTSPITASALGILITLWGVLLLVVMGPRYLSRAGRLVTNLEMKTVIQK